MEYRVSVYGPATFFFKVDNTVPLTSLDVRENLYYVLLLVMLESVYFLKVYFLKVGFMFL